MHSLFTEHRLIHFAETPSAASSPQEAAPAATSPTPSAASPSPKTPRASIQYSSVLPVLGVSKLLGDKTPTWKKTATEATAAALVPGYLPAALAYNIAAPVINTAIFGTRKAIRGAMIPLSGLGKVAKWSGKTLAKPFTAANQFRKNRKAKRKAHKEEIAKKKAEDPNYKAPPGMLRKWIARPIGSVSKGAYHRITNLLGTGWGYTFGTAKRIINTPLAALHAAKSVALGTPLAIAGGITKSIHTVLGWGANLTTKPLNALANSLMSTSDPWYGLSFVPKMTKWLDETVRANWIHSGGSWGWEIAKSEIKNMGLDTQDIARNMKRQILQTVGMVPQVGSAVIQPKEGHLATRSKVDTWAKIESHRARFWDAVIKVLSWKRPEEGFTA